jgi:hypothetical protein
MQSKCPCWWEGPDGSRVLMMYMHGYAHASGWGRKGSDATALSFDYTGIARCGMMMSCGERGTPPAQILPGIGDEIGGLMCAWGVTAALYAREKTGKGQVVDTSLMGSLVAMLGFIMAAPAILASAGQQTPAEQAVTRPLTRPVPAPPDVPKSVRVVKERQRPLFRSCRTRRCRLSPCSKMRRRRRTR